MEKKTFQKPEVKFVQMNTLNILASSNISSDIIPGGTGPGPGGHRVKAVGSSTSIPTSSSANWD